MRTDILEKLLKIADAIGEHGNVNLTRRGVLKKWFEKPERLSAFAIWIATCATSRKHKTGGAAVEIFREAKALLAGADKCQPQLDHQKTQTLHDRLPDFRNEYRKQRWGAVRIVHNWNLMLVEQAWPFISDALTLRRTVTNWLLTIARITTRDTETVRTAQAGRKLRKSSGSCSPSKRLSRAQSGFPLKLTRRRQPVIPWSRTSEPCAKAGGARGASAPDAAIAAAAGTIVWHPELSFSMKTGWNIVRANGFD